MKATNEMTTNGRIGTKHVMVLLSDGVPEVLGMTTAEASADAVAKATTAKSLGTVVYTIIILLLLEQLSHLFTKR